MAESLRALILDDEQSIRFFLSETLSSMGYKVVGAGSGEEALELLRETLFDLAILDLKLGGRIDGLKVLEAIRWRWPDTVVIILTAHGSFESALSAIEQGVDGYMLKPIEPEELRGVVAEAFARRERLRGGIQESPRDNRSLQIGGLAVDQDRRLVTLEEQPLPLTPSEYRLLIYLMQNADRVSTPQELVRVVQGYECEESQEAREIIKWYIYRLRRKIEADPSQPRYIVNVRGVGYTIQSEVDSRK